MNKIKWLRAALILYLCVVLWGAVFSRGPSDERVVKLHSETILYLMGHYPDWQSDYTALHPESMVNGDLLNIFMFLPIGLLSEAILISRKRKHSLLWCAIWSAACSLTIEVIQLITRRGWFDMDDLLMNVLGAVLGGTVCLLFYKLFYGKHTRPEK